MKRVYIIVNEHDEMKIFVIENEHDQTVFELEYADKIKVKGDSIQDCIIQVSKILEKQ